MGTKFEQIIDNIARNRVYDKENHRSRGLRKMSEVERLQDVTKRMLEKGDVELIRSTMQTHEDVFKHQVKELHQLYIVQRELMDVLRNKIDHMHYQRLRDAPSSRERSGSCSGDSTRNSRELNLQSLTEAYTSTENGTINEDRVSLSVRHDHKSERMIMVNDEHDEDSEVELTLSVGVSQSKKRSKSSSPLKHESTHRGINLSSSFQHEREKESSDPMTPMSSSSASCDPDSKRSHWIFQSLKL